MKIHQRIVSFLIPILTAVYPVLFLAAQNTSQIKTADIGRTLLIALGGAILIGIICCLVLRSVEKGVLLASLILLLLESYGHIRRVLYGFNPFIGKHTVIFLLIAVVILLTTVILFRTKRSLLQVNQVILLIVSVLVLFSAVPVGLAWIEQIKTETANKRSAPSTVISTGNNPDIYFIVLDSYARQDVLKDKFGFDNSPFMNDLNNMGFKFVPCSQSNYQVTMLSLISTLNMEYLTDIPSNDAKVVDKKYELTREQVLNNKVWRFLEARGYQSVAFDTGYPFSELTNATHYFPVILNRDQVNNFEHMAINATIWSAIEPVINRNKPAKNESIPFDEFDESPEYFYQVHLNALDVMEDVTNIESPKFVYGHIAFPHDPYVFSASGENVIDKPVKGDPYIAQTKYANTRFTRIIRKIIENSAVPPIIILESDHGYGPNDPDTRLKNMMAFYAPESVTDAVYDTITPVNSFRLVFSKVFSADLPLLPDYSFFSPELEKKDFNVMPSSCPE